MELLNLQATTTMSSREIAELTKKNHADVMRDIRKMLKDLEKDQSSFADIFFDSYEREQPMFCLPYDETVCLLTGYDAKARMAVIKRWKELEAMQAPVHKVPQSFADALLLAGAQQKEIEQKALQIENLSTALDTLLDWVSILKIAKHNKVSEKKFDWRKLKTTSEQIGYIIKKAESPRFGYQNLYHVNVFKACYPKFNYSFAND